MAPDTRYKHTPKPVKRWQSRDLGALWQYDASPHAWLPGNCRFQNGVMPPRRTIGRLMKRKTLFLFTEEVRDGNSMV
jgi:hypothetical protein